MNSVHHDTEIARTEPSPDAYVVCFTLGLENHWNAINFTS